MCSCIIKLQYSPYMHVQWFSHPHHPHVHIQRYWLRHWPFNQMCLNYIEQTFPFTHHTLSPSHHTLSPLTPHTPHTHSFSHHTHYTLTPSHTTHTTHSHTHTHHTAVWWWHVWKKSCRDNAGGGSSRWSICTYPPSSLCELLERTWSVKTLLIS